MQPSDKATVRINRELHAANIKQNLHQRRRILPSPAARSTRRHGRQAEVPPARLRAVRASPSPLPAHAEAKNWRGFVSDFGGSGSIHDGAAGVGGVGGARVGGGVAAGGVQPGDAPARPRPRADLLRAAPPPRAPRRLPLHPLPPRASPRPSPAPPRLPRSPASGACAAPLHLLVQLLLVLVFGGRG